MRPQFFSRLDCFAASRLAMTTLPSSLRASLPSLRASPPSLRASGTLPSEAIQGESQKMTCSDVLIKTY
ncbi:MAG: hypothetical protein LBT00_08740 [Spirochaetaceae bacterium]|nr:hypothetical protein [Spirochaetaceae bacterium]